MSLTWRFLLLLNLTVVAVMQGSTWFYQERWLRSQAEAYQEFSFTEMLSEVYSSANLDTTTDRTKVLDLLDNRWVRANFRDLLVTNGRPPRPGYVHLNPKGAVERDPLSYPRVQVIAGLERAVETGEVVRAGDGVCVPIVSRQGVAAGSVWFQPIEPAPPEAPWSVFLVSVLVSSLLFGVVGFWTVRRTLVKPLQRIADAAQRVGAGQYSSRVPKLAGATELNTLVEEFNAMADRVEGSAGELQQKVDEAVAATQARERALVLSSRLAAMGTLAAGIAHEINNPIGGMSNAVQRMKKSEELTERGTVYLDLVQNGLDRVAGIVRRVLDFTPRTVQAEPFALRDTWDAALALVAHRVEQAGVVVTTNFQGDLPPVHGDRHEIQQVLLNLLINSLDAFDDMDPALRPQTMTVTVTASTSPEEGVLVEVADNGPGMAEADVPRVFDPFFSAKERPDASGLGMFISYTIVQNHGGTMDVSSVPGRGFRTTLSLPVGPMA